MGNRQGRPGGTVPAQDGHAGQVFDGRQARDDGAVVRQLLGAQRQRGGGDDLDGQRDGGHEQHHGERKSFNDALVVLQQVDEHRDAQHQRQHDQHDHDPDQGLLQVGDFRRAAEERGRLAEERARARELHRALRLAADHGRALHKASGKGEQDKRSKEKRGK